MPTRIKKKLRERVEASATGHRRRRGTLRMVPPLSARWRAQRKSGGAFASLPRSWWISLMRIREGGARDAEPSFAPLSSNELAERWPRSR